MVYAVITFACCPLTFRVVIQTYRVLASTEVDLFRWACNVGIDIYGHVGLLFNDNEAVTSPRLGGRQPAT